MNKNFIKNLKDISRIFRAKLSIFFSKRESSYSLSDLKILKTIEKELNKSTINKSSKLNTHTIFSEKILNLIKKKDLLNFLQNGDIQQMFFIHNRIFIIFELLGLINDKKWLMWKNLIKENDHGNPVRFFVYPYASGNKIHQVNHLKKFNNFCKHDLKNFKNVFEFGGGYGNMAYTFNKINKNTNYIIFDTLEVNLLQYYYLKKNKLSVGFGYKTKNKIKLVNKFDDLKILIKKINKNDNNLFIANWSLSEVPISFRKKLEFINKKFDFRLFSFQKKFENIDNLKYFKKINLENKKRKLKSDFFEIKGKKNNYYLFSSK